jgi:hypothetical protein
LKGNNIAAATKERTPALSRIMLVSVMTTMMFLVLFSAAPASSSILSFQQQDEASAYGLEQRVPPAYIVIDGKPSRLQLEDEPMSQDRIANYDRAPQGTISFGERFQLLVPQVPGIFKDVQSATLYVNDDVFNENDYLQTDIERVNVRDTRLLYLETYLNAVPGGGDPDALGDGYTASDVGFRIFLWWQVFFTDGTDQTYLAIVHLQGDPCEEHGWAYSRSGTTCVDPDE